MECAKNMETGNGPVTKRDSPSREQRLLVLAARADLGPGEAEEIKDLLAVGVDWNNLLDHSSRLGIRPLLYRHLSQDGYCYHVPREMMALLRKDYELQTLKNLRIYGCIRRLLSCLHREGLPIILLKGAFLARWVYPDIGLRPMSDIDILCHSEDRLAVEKSLKGIGVTQKDGPEAFQSPLHQEVLSGHMRHLPGFFDRKIVKVELHTRLFYSPEANKLETIRLMWDRTLRHEWDGLAFQSLSPADQLLFQCVHLFHHAQHRQATLYWFCDIHETISHYGKTIDWNSLLGFAEKIGVRRQLETVLILMKTHWNTPVPGERVRIAGKPEITLPEVLGFVPGSSIQAKRNVLSAYYQKAKIVRELSGWKKRVYFVWKLVFPSMANIRYRYQPANAFMLSLWCMVHPMIRVKRAVESLFCHAVYRVKIAMEEPEIRGQRSEVRDQRSEVGGQRSGIRQKVRR